MEEKRIKEIVDQDAPRFKETLAYIYSSTTPDVSILEISKDYGWEATLGLHLKTKGYNLTFFGNDDVRFKWEKYADNSFDVITAFEIFEHLNPINGRDEYEDLMISSDFFLKECTRVLRPGGILLLSTPNVASYYCIEKLFKGEYPYYYWHFREYDAHQLMHAVSRCGLKPTFITTIVNEENAHISGILTLHGYSNELRGKHLFMIAKK